MAEATKQRSESSKSESGDSNSSAGSGGLLDALPTDQLNDEFRRLVSAFSQRMLSSASTRVGSLVDKFDGGGSDAGDDGSGGKRNGKSAGGAAMSKAGKEIGEGKSPVKAALSGGAEAVKEKVTGLFKGKGGGGQSGKRLKVTNIVEEIDVGAPVDVVYDQWTQLQDFPNFMKKVDSVEQTQDEKVNFKAQVFWSHRMWEATIVDQVPNKHIVWRSSGEKGHVDGAVTFHELAPELTRVLVVLEYYPQGLFERTGNLWRAQGRRVRLELKHFRRHVMTDVMLHPDDLSGWHGEIHDSQVETSDEDARREQDRQDGDEADFEDEPEEDEADQDDEPRGRVRDDDTDEDEDEDEEEEADDDEDDYDDEDHYDDEADDDEADEDTDDTRGEADYDDSDYDDTDYDEDEDRDEDDFDDDEQPARGRRRAGAGRR